MEQLEDEVRRILGGPVVGESHSEVEERERGGEREKGEDFEKAAGEGGRRHRRVGRTTSIRMHTEKIV